MKKLITGILATLSCLTFMAGCVVADQSSSTPNTDSSPSASDTGSTSTPDAHDPLAGLNDAKDFLYLKMKDDSNTSTTKDYKILNTYPGENDETYTVTVSVDVTEGVTVVAGETEWTVKIIYIHQGKKGWEGTKDTILQADNAELNDFVFASSMAKRAKANLER